MSLSSWKHFEYHLHLLILFLHTSTWNLSIVGVVWLFHGIIGILSTLEGRYCLYLASIFAAN